MILDLMQHWPVRREGSFVIGDRPTDIEAAEAAGLPGFLVTAGEQEAGQSGSFRCLDISGTVANDKTAFAAHRPMLHQVEDHARARLSPGALFELAGNRPVG